MATRNVDTAIRYAISVSEKGLQQAVALTKDLSVQSKATQVGVDASMKAVQTQYNALAKVAASADSAVAKAAIDSATTVNKALDSQVAKLRDAGASYTAIIAKQKELGASAAELAAAVRRSSTEQIASMRAVRAEADKLSISQRLGAVGSRIGGAAAGVASTAGSGLLAGAGIAGALAYTGLEKSRGVIEGTLAIRGATGLPSNQALALSTIATSLGIAPRSIGQAFGTLGGVTTKALAGNTTAGAAFSTLGISRQTVAADVNNPLALFDLVTKNAATLPATQRSAIQRQLLGRGSTIVGQLTAGGSLAESVAQVQKDIPGLDPKKLIAMQEAFIHLKEVTTAFELSFAQAFGPAIGKGLTAIIPLLKPIAAGFKDAFGLIKGVVDGPVGQALGKFGQMAFDAGKKLVEAFKPAMPFFQNVLLPLVKGVAIGIGIGLLGAIKGVTVVVQVLAPIFGALGDAMKPLKTVIQDVGTVLGVFFGGGVIGKIAEGFAAFVGEVPLVGKALELIVKPIEVVGSGIGKLFEVVAGTFGKILDFIPGVGSKLASLLGGLAASIVGAFAAVPNAVGSVFSSIGDVIGNALVAAVNIGIGVINSGSGLINSFTHAVGLGNVLPNLQPLTVAAAPAPAGVTAPRHGGTFRDGGLVFNAGGLVPAMVSPQEQVIYGNSSWMVPGSPTAADSVFAMLPPGAAVMTGHGQALMGMGASLDEALAMQMPHFAAGGAVNALGWNVKAPGGRGGHGGRSRGHSRGSTATPRYLHNVLIGNFTTAGWHAYLLAHPSTSSTRALSHYGIPGLVGLAEGGGFSGENAAIAAAIAEAESGGDVHSVNTAGNSPPSRDRGLWQFNDYWNKNISDQVAFDPFAAAKAAYQTFRSRGFRDWVTYNQGQYRRFLPAAEAALHSGVAPITSGTPQGVLQAAARAKVGIPTLSNATASLTGQTAFGGGFQAGLSGQNLIDTLRSGVLSQLIGDVAISSGGLIGGLNISAGQQASQPAAGGRYGAMLAKANEIAGHRYNYEWGGGHSNFTPSHGSGHGSGPGIGYDCSGAVSTVLHAGGLLRSPMVASDFMSWGQKGRGRQVSVFSSPSHVFMELGGRYFGTSTMTPGGGANWIPRFPENMPATTHPPGMRTGGVVGKGIAFSPTRIPRVNPLAQPLRGVSALLSQSDASDVSAIMGLLASELDNVHALTFQNLQDLAAQLSRHSLKGLDPIQRRRLATATNLVDAAIGNRIGLAVQAAQEAVDTIARSNAHRVALNTLAGVDPSSTAGLRLAVQLDQAVVQGLNAQVGTLNQALATAKKYGDKATIKAVTDELNTALGNLDQAAIQAMTDWKASIERAAQDSVDAASQAVSVATAGEGILSLQQQLAGTDQTPGAGQQTAAYINSTVIPAFRAQLAAQQADQAAAASVGDTARVNADILSELQTQTSILSEQKTAQDAIKANTTPLKTFGGQLAFQFQGSNFTDLAALAPGS